MRTVDPRDYGALESTPRDFSTVTLFEQKIAEFFGAPYAVATDSCTSAIELCLRYNKMTSIEVPKQTYLSVPMLADKLNIKLSWIDLSWKQYYMIGSKEGKPVFDAATFWKHEGYSDWFNNSLVCLSFQHQKHLSLGRGGMILCDNKEAADQLKKMSYDGRLPGIPWRDQDIDTMGYHYYMTPETSQLGLEKLDAAIAIEPKIWDSTMYPDVSKMKVFNPKAPIFPVDKIDKY